MVADAGAVGVAVLPDFSRFGPAMRSGVGRAVAGVDVETPFREQGRRAGKAMADETGRTASKHGSTAMVSAGKSIGGGFRASVMAPLAMLGPQMAAAMGVVAIAQGIKGATDAASDMNETVSASGQVFGKSAPEIQKWASTAATSLGLSNQKALEGATLFGNFFSQIGIGAGLSVKMSEGFVQMSSDFASFYNADPAQVMDAFASATRGEYDALQRFLPTINAATVEAEALRETHKKSAKDLTAAEKATALYTLAQKGAGAASGDFQRTSQGLANQQRIMSAQWQDMQVKIGTFFLPILNKVMIFINQVVIPGLYKLGDFLGAVFTGQWAKAWTMIQNFGKNLGGWLVSTGSMIWQKLQVWGKAFVDWIGPRWQPMLAALWAFLQKVGTWITGTALPWLQDHLLAWGKAFWAWISPMIPPVLRELWNLAQKLGGWLWNTGLPWLRDHLLVWGKALWEWVSPMIPPLLRTIWELAQKLGAWLWNVGLPWLIDHLKTWGKALIDWIGPMIMPMLTKIGEFAGKLLGWLIGTGLPRLISKLWEWGTALISWLLPRLPGMLGNLLKFVLGMTAWLIFVGLPKLVAAVVKIAVAFIGGFWDSIKNSDLGKKVQGFFMGIVDFLKKPVNAIIGFINDKLIDKINAVLSAIGVGTIPLIPTFALGGAVDTRGGLRKPMRSGGRVHGPGTGTSDSIPAWLSNGEFVINAKATRQFLPLLQAINGGMGAGGDGFALGGWVGSVAGWASNLAKKGASWVLNNALGPVQTAMDALVPPGVIRTLIHGWLGKLRAWGTDQGDAGKQVGQYGDWHGGAGVEQWRNTALRALAAAGAPSSWIGSLLRRMNQESGGNPNAINLWDSNAKAGYPSQGLMQTIPGTFYGYAGPYASRGIRDPFANIYAAIKYTIARYGSGPKGWDRAGGYDSGGWLQPGYTLAYNGTGKPEAVFTSEQFDLLKAGRGGANVTVIAQNVPTDAAIRRALRNHDLLYG